MKYPDPVMLNGEALPWFDSADHLGHIIDQSITMEKDCRRTRAKYVSKSLEIRNTLGLVDPELIMKALQVYCSDAYGCMLWDLGSPEAESFFKCWNTNVKFVFGLPRTTYTYLVEGHFAKGTESLRNQIYVRYSSFYRKLITSPSKEVRILARMVRYDPRSVTCKNLSLLNIKSSLNNVYMYSRIRLKEALPSQEVPVEERWRLGLLNSLLLLKNEKMRRFESIVDICAMIESLCST